jgi:osmotically-inducible protein OsmY
MNTSSRIQRIVTAAIFVTLTASVFAQTPDAASATPSIQPAPSSKAADRKLARKVARVLARTHGVNSTRLLVKSQNGVVTLGGSVMDDAQIPLAVEAAKDVDGVREVQNRIRVSGASL